MTSTLFRSLIWLTASLSLLATALATNTYCNTDASAGAEPARPEPQAVPIAKENPTVKPGLVNWHPTFADARAAAEKSGKPVLLFHMMGQLDKQFC
jgi:hypothetical protein